MKRFTNCSHLLAGGAVVEMPWIGETKALLNSYLGGEASGSAVTDILFGDVNPSGKLADTIPDSYDSYQNAQEFLTGFEHLDYFDDIYVGYRYFETIPGAAEKVRYPFGFGLSYTDFEFSGAFCGESDGKIVAAVTVKKHIESLRQKGSVKAQKEARRVPFFQRQTAKESL